MSLLPLLATATGALVLVFAAVFALARRIDNYGVVDVAWSYAFGAMAAFYALEGQGWPIRRALIATLVVVWSLRLGTHLAIRVRHHHPKEDGRYEQLRRDWAGHFAAKMFGFFQLQAVSVVLLGVTFALGAENPDPTLHPVEIVGAVLWLLAVTAEAIADRQLAMFKKTAGANAGVCTVGLWRYSRHPNYFFEWLIWVAFFVFGLGSAWGWVGIIGPASILWLLLRVTGIPMTEAQSLRSRGDAYRRYQRSTSAFVPWFPKRDDTTPRH
jgi:steroid 5-alpha reductase family enzyme